MKKRYDKDFKKMLVELLISGQSATSLEAEYGVHASSIRKWRRQYESILSKV